MEHEGNSYHCYHDEIIQKAKTNEGEGMVIPHWRNNRILSHCKLGEHHSLT